MENITERIEIINSSNLLYASRSKIGSVLNYIYLLFTIVLLSTVLWSIINEFAGFSSKLTWNRNSMLVLFSISILFNAVKEIYSRMLLKHLDFLTNSAPKNLNERSNLQLAKIIAAHKNPVRSNWFITLLSIIILIGCVTNFFMDEQFVYYKFFIAPTLLFYFLTIFDGVKTYKKLKANIQNVEN